MLTRFGICADLPEYTTEHDPPLTEPEDAAFKTFLTTDDLTGLPVVMPYGIPNTMAGGVVLYGGRGRMELVFALLYTRNPADRENPVGTTQELFAELKKGRRKTRCQFWINIPNLDTMVYEKIRATIPLPEWPELLTPVLKNVKLEVRNLGLNILDPAFGENGYNGGEPSPPSGPGSSGSALVNTLDFGALDEGALDESDESIDWTFLEPYEL